MAAPSKTKKFEQLVKLLQKRFKGLSAPQERPVLDQLIYAALLENATYEQADAAFTVLENYFIDWNEVRVSTVSELADVFTMLPDPQAAGDRVRCALQAVFEKTYEFDLEELTKKNKNLGQSVDFFESLSACSRFMIDYVTQVSLGGHVIPFDEAALRIFRLLGLTQVNADRTKEEVSGFERAIPKKNGSTVSLQLHHFATAYFNDPESDELRALLKSIDAEALTRDWTPPALVVLKTQPPVKETLSKTIPSLPFVATDEDDFDEDHVGMEAEFISEDPDYISEDAGSVRKTETPAHLMSEKKESKKTKEKTPEKKSAVEKSRAEKKSLVKTDSVSRKKTVSQKENTAGSKKRGDNKEKSDPNSKVSSIKDKKKTTTKEIIKPAKTKSAVPAKKTEKQTDKKKKFVKKDAKKSDKKTTKSKKPK